MAKTSKKRVLVPKGKREALHLKLAYNLGRTVKKVSKTVKSVKVKGISGDKTKGYEKKEPLSPILKEIKAIADVSGLTAAVEKMNEINLKHSSHPVITRITNKIKNLSPMEQEWLSRKFIDRLQSRPSFNQAMNFSSIQNEMTEEECQKISDDLIESIFYTLEEVGITPEDKKFLQKFSDDMAQPLYDLIQLYLHPKTFGQKVKRLWRMQRIFMKLIKLIHLTNDLAKNNPDAFMGGSIFKNKISSNEFISFNPSVISIQGRTIK